MDYDAPVDEDEGCCGCCTGWYILVIRGGAANFGFISITYHQYIFGLYKYILRLEISIFELLYALGIFSLAEGPQQMWDIRFIRRCFPLSHYPRLH